jgi:oxalate decarboxylase/phosphoglucose isomerase-like protein (cupin superfamily)
LIVLDGQADLIIPDGLDDANARTEHLQKGSFVYYPAYQHHTIRNCSSKPITYLMFKWRGELARNEKISSTSIVNLKFPPTPASTPFFGREAI